MSKSVDHMFNKLATALKNFFPAPEVHAHCDGPCGVYDPASARITAEAVLSMTKKIMVLEPAAGDEAATIAYQNTLSRYIAIKEEQAQKTKEDLLILWTDYFKPEHLEKFPNLHDLYWNATKKAGEAKKTEDPKVGEELIALIDEIDSVFKASKS